VCLILLHGMPTGLDPQRRRLRRRRVLLLVLSTLFCLAADQAVNFFVLRDGWFLGARIAPFDPPLFSRVQLDVVQRLRRELAAGTPSGRPIRFDAALGWGHVPSSGSGEDRFDELGGRIAGRPSPHARRAGAHRILVFGDSFTYGTEVAANDSWPAQLARLRPDLEVVNLGVPGYGLDQAFLRWRRDGKDVDADEVWLGFLPAAAERNVNVYRPALSHWSPTVAFKPRFRLGKGGELIEVPQPAHSIEDVLRLTSSAAAFLAAVGDTDAFVSRSRPAYMPRGSHWTHYFALGRLAWTLLDRRGRDPSTLLADRNGEVFAVTRAIGRQMAREVAATGQRFRLLVLPGRDDIVHAVGHAQAPWAALEDAWRADGIEVVDLTATLCARGAPAGPALWAAGGHYTAVANAAVAARLART
jgi:hypothetical protein